MTTLSQIQLRDARDRVIDLLGFGQTYPLRDLLPSQDLQLKVTFDTPARIPIENSQKGVLYQLRFKGEPVEERDDGTGAMIQAEGNGATILLDTPPIVEDITYQIYASKVISGRGAYLHQKATVKVGLELTLLAWIRNAPHLEPHAGTPTDAMPRICDYAAQIEVEVEKSQEGVDYQLVYRQTVENGQDLEEVVISDVDVRGDLHNIILATQPVHEDVDIRIRATKTFDPSMTVDVQTELLDIVLPLKVRANPALPVSVEPSPIIGFAESPTIKIEDTQQSVRYKLYIHTVADQEFIHGPPQGRRVVRVPVEGELDVQIRTPARGQLWTEPEGYIALDDQPGSGSEIRFTLPALKDDSLLIVQAAKAHETGMDSAAGTIASAIQLEQAVAILVRPVPEPPLRVKVWIEAARTSGEMEIAGGQPGVFYFFRLAGEDGADLGVPAYFHKRDEHDDRVNQGLGQLPMEVDFVVARPLPPALVGADLAQVPPQLPLIDTGSLPVNSLLTIQAVKAQTRLATALDETLEIPAGPEIEPESPVIDYDTSTRIRIIASRARERYQLLLDGHPLADPVKGTGQNRLLETRKLLEDTTFELQVTQTDETFGIERVFTVIVLVRPDQKCPVSAADAIVDYNSGTEIQVENSQIGVRYQLMVEDEPLGDAVEGTGDKIALPTGVLTQETTFTVRAAKIAHPEIAVVLDQPVTVQVRPEPDQ
jgi:hypothetical protein